jgi:hypothetical protein
MTQVLERMTDMYSDNQSCTRALGLHHRRELTDSTIVVGAGVLPDLAYSSLSELPIDF